MKLALCTALCFGSVWVFFLGVAVSSRRAIAADLRALAEMSCPTCGTPYGPATAQRAREDYLAECGRIREANPAKHTYEEA